MIMIIHGILVHCNLSNKKCNDHVYKISPMLVKCTSLYQVHCLTSIKHWFIWLRETGHYLNDNNRRWGNKVNPLHWEGNTRVFQFSKTTTIFICILKTSERITLYVTVIHDINVKYSNSVYYRILHISTTYIILYRFATTI